MLNTTVADLETKITQRGYTLKKEYDNKTGICKVVAFNRLKDTTIKSQNTSRNDIWNAYRRALEFILADLEQFEKIAGKGI